jgi:hypothetical protein
MTKDRANKPILLQSVLDIRGVDEKTKAKLIKLYKSINGRSMTYSKSVFRSNLHPCTT